MKLKQFVLTSLVINLFMSVSITVFAQQTSETSVTQSDSNQEVLSMYEEDITTAQSVLKTLSELPENFSATIQLLDLVKDSDYQATRRAFLKDGEYYYFESTAFDKIQSNLMFKTENEKVQQVIISAKDLADAAAQALNEDDTKYVGTAVESYYQYAQANLDEIETLYIEEDNSTGVHQALLDESLKMTQFITTVFLRLLETQEIVGDVIEVNESEKMYMYVVDEAISKMLGEIAEQESAQIDEDMSEIVALLQAGYVGTFGVIASTGNFAMSLASLNGNHVFEYFVGDNQVEINWPSDEKIISKEAFISKVGVDIFTQTQETVDTP